MSNMTKEQCDVEMIEACSNWLKSKGIPVGAAALLKSDFLPSAGSVFDWRRKFLVLAGVTDMDGAGIIPRIPSADAYRHYQIWCKDNGRLPVSHCFFSRQMKIIGLASKVCNIEGQSVRAFEYVTWAEPPREEPQCQSSPPS